MDIHKGYEYHSTGLCSSCAVCQQEQDMDEAELQAGIESGEVFEEAEFSWSPCDWCGSTLGGDRYPAHAVCKETGEIEHFEICIDCLQGDC